MNTIYLSRSKSANFPIMAEWKIGKINYSNVFENVLQMENYFAKFDAVYKASKKLAGQIVETFKDYDIYEFRNCYDNEKQAIKETAELLKSDPGVVQFALTEMAAECEWEIKEDLLILRHIVAQL